MFTHHLSFVQSRFLFVTQDGVALRATNELNPADHRLFELRAIIVATIAVEEFPIYWQRLYFADEPLPLASFLYLAWSQRHNLLRMPQRLLVQPEMVDLVRCALTVLDSKKVVQTLEPGLGYGFDATKRQAELYANHCIDPVFEKENPRSPLATQTATLGRLNERLSQYHRQRQSTLDPTLPHWAAEFDYVLNGPLHDPTMYYDLLEVSLTDRLQRPLPRQHISVPACELRVEADCGWCAVVSTLSGKLRKPAFSPYDQDLYLVHELPWFKSTVRSLAFPPEKLFGEVIESADLEDFLNFRKQLSGAVAADRKSVV